MGRYDKIKTWNGTSWVQPTEIKVWNGSSYVSYGANDSDNTNSIYTWNGSEWKRMTLNKKVTQTGTNYSFDSWAQFWPQSGWPENNGTYFSQGAFNCTVPAGYNDWQAWSSYLVGDFGTGSWFAVSRYQSNAGYNFYWRRTTPFWLHNVGFRTASTTYWGAYPTSFELWKGDRATFVGNYSFYSAGAANTRFWVGNGIDYKPNGGMTSFTMYMYDGNNKFTNGYSLRFGAVQIEAGTANSTPVYTTTWE